MRFLVTLLQLANILVTVWAGTVQFVDTQVIAEEGQEFNIQVRHTGDISGIINVVVSVSSKVFLDEP